MVCPPPRARSTVSASVSAVAGSTLASRQGRSAAPINPPAAICSRFAVPVRAAGSGGGASGAVPHNCASRLAPPTPSTTA
ncbi:hypothetical protein MOKP46_36620 [Mycobacterium avium subsp. hominissuis]